MTIGSNKFIQWTDRLAGEGHPLYADTLNEHLKIDHTQDGHHKWLHFHENSLPSTGTDEFILGAYNDGTQTELFGRSEDNGDIFQITKGGKLYTLNNVCTDGDLTTGTDNSLIVTPARSQRFIYRDGTRILTSDWDIGTGRKILFEKLSARSAAGLRLEDDDSNLGVFIKDGGYVGVNDSNPDANLTVTGTTNIKSTQPIAQVGSELITNGTFESSLTGWSYGGGSDWAWSSGKALHNTGNTTSLSQVINVSSGDYFAIEFTVSDRTAGSFSVIIGGSYIYNGASLNYNSNTTYKRCYKASVSSGVTISFVPTSDFDGKIDDVTVVKITGTSSAVFCLSDSSGMGSCLRSSSVQNVFSLGKGSGDYLYNGSLSLFFGDYSGQFAVCSQQNTFLGNSCGRFGYNSGYNVGVGQECLRDCFNGYYNNFIGYRGGYQITFGNGNVGIGHYVGQSLTEGINNSLIGLRAGNSLTVGNTNTLLGYYAGSGLTTADYCIIIGNQPYAVDAITDYQIRIGENLFGDRYNFSLGGYGWGTNAQKVFALYPGTAPTTGISGSQLYSSDLSGTKVLTTMDSDGVEGIIPQMIIKNTTGDPSGRECLVVINTFDNNIKAYADGAWRTIVSW